MVSFTQLEFMLKTCMHKTCALDPIPTWLLFQHLDELRPVLLWMVNLALRDGLPATHKKSTVTPLLKKKGADPDSMGNYRPVSCLPFVAKLTEKAVSFQLMNYLEAHGMLDPRQSAYRRHHSCETAVLTVLNDSLLAMDNKEVTLLVLLDLSSAFDSVDHSILSNRLRSCGIQGHVHHWIMNYLAKRTQCVSVKDCSSQAAPLTCGVPQGSVLGPLLFLIYLTGLRDAIAPSAIHYMLYADDLQLYISSSVAMLPVSIAMMQDCVVRLKQWFAASLLTLNDAKTECILLGTPALLEKCSLTHINLGDAVIPISPSVRDLGVMLDSSLNLKTHVSKVCSKAYAGLRMISRLRKALSVQHYSLLANSLVLSHLEFCSAVFLGCPKILLDKLQKVVNATFRSVHRLKKRDHITDRQRAAGCLSMEQRIDKRVACIIFKALKFGAPTYVKDMLVPLRRQRTLRSNDQGLLTCPRVRSSIGGRAFSAAAPVLWNAFPKSVRDADTLEELITRL